MKRQNYYPSRISQQVAWHTNYRDKISGYATAAGIAGPDTAVTVADAKWLIYVLGAWLGEVRTFAQSATAAVEIIQSGLTGGSTYPVPVFTPPALPGSPLPPTVPVAAGALSRIFVFVQRIKDASNYTLAVGEDLGIEGAEETDHPTPKITLKVGQGPGCQCVEFSIIKYTHEGVVIEGRRGGAWEQVGVTTARTFTDERPLLVASQPEVREYRVRYWDKGIANGPWTDVQKVTVAP